MDYQVTKLKKHKRSPDEEDERGFLVEFLKRHELEEEDKEFAQVYLSTIAPNTIRGNHYHKTKKEFFVIMSGKALIVLEDVNTKERKEIICDSSEEHITRVSFGPNIAHAIKNTSDKTIFLTAYTTKPYDPNNLDQIDYSLL